MGIQKTPRQIIKNAFAKLAIWSPADEDYTYGFEMLNNVLSTLSVEGINIQTITEDVFTMTAGRGYYSIGIGASDINTVLPEEIISSVISASETMDCQVLPKLSLEEYNSVWDKTCVGMPNKMCYVKNYPTGKLLYYPAPDAAYTNTLSSKKALTSMSGLDDAYDIHQKYYDLLEGSLTISLAPRFNAILDQSIGFLVTNLKNTIQNSNVRNEPPVDLGIISRRFYR